MQPIITAAAIALLCCCVGLAHAEGESAGGCNNAIFVQPPYTGGVVFGDTRAAQGFTNKCSGSSDEDCGTLFYIITPDSGSRVNVTTCHDGTDFDTVLAVYSGTDCSNLQCVLYNDDFCQGGASFISFAANSGQYWIDSGSEGEFEMSFYEEVQQPSNGCQARDWWQVQALSDQLNGSDCLRSEVHSLAGGRVSRRLTRQCPRCAAAVDRRQPASPTAYLPGLLPEKDKMFSRQLIALVILALVGAGIVLAMDDNELVVGHWQGKLPQTLE